MRVTKYVFIGIVLCFFFSCQYFDEWDKKKAGVIIEKIEEFKSNTGHYPHKIYGLASKNDFWNLPQEKIDSLVSGKQYSIYVIKGQKIWFVLDKDIDRLETYDGSESYIPSVFEINGKGYSYDNIIRRDSTFFELYFDTGFFKGVVFSSGTNKWKDIY